jgi:hypothetical protein
MRFNSETEIDDFLARFEAGTLPKAEWTHPAHLAVAGAYVWRDPDTALPQIRLGILLLNRHQGTVNSATSGYHETLTVFWVEMVRAFCRRHKTTPRLAVINEMLETLPAGLFREFYRFDIVQSKEARERWIAPDRRSLP